MLIDTLKAKRCVYRECTARKVKSGEDVRASSRHSGKGPRELKAQEGIEQ
jgi:hypothetical protein